MAEHLTPAQATEIETALAQGQKIAAIKLYREFTGAGLKEAKEAIESWPAGGTGAGAAAGPRPTGARLTPAQAAEIEAALAQGRRLPAIKLYREFTGAGLKDAKDVICGLADELYRRDPAKYPAPRSAGCASAIAFGLALAGAAAVVLVWVWRVANT